MEIGHIVEFIDHEKILCAVVVEIKKERLRILTENGREVKLAAGRLARHGTTRIEPGTGRVRTIETLRAVTARRRALAAGIDVPLLWETLNEDRTWIDLDTMTGLCFPGLTDDDHRSAVVRALFDHRLYFRYDRNRFLPASPEDVRQRLAKEAEEARRRWIVTTAVRWLKAVRESDPPPPAPAVEASTDLESMLLAYLLHGRDSAHGSLVKEIATRAGIAEAEGLLPVLIKSGKLAPDVNLDLYRHRIPVEFSGAQTNAARVVPVPDGPRNGRRDLTDLPLLTIDGRSTLDFDDALSLEPLAEGWRLGVHIADVGAAVARDGILDAAAQERASSIYMPDRKIPMLPPVLAEDGCSLRAGRVRPAISLLVTLDGRLEIAFCEICASRIRVSERLTYQDVDSMLDRREDLDRLRRIALRSRQRRLEAGAVQINIPEVVATVNGRGRVEVLRLDRESPSRLIVSELMILTNRLKAEALARWELPAVFRGQPAPRERLYQGEEGTLFEHHMQRKLLSRLVLDTRPAPHAGLGLDAYVTATSPIRKYIDLVTQRQLRAGLGLEEPYSEEELSGLLRTIEQPLARVALIQRNRQRYWLLRYLEGRVGAKEEAVCLQRRRSGCLILMPAYMLECDMPLSGGAVLNPEDLVQVTIQHVDARRNLLRVFPS